MTLHVNFTCIVKDCAFSKKIVTAPKSVIITHLIKHDYGIILELCAEFKIIKNTTERRSPYWLVEQLLEFCINEVDQ